MSPKTGVQFLKFDYLSAEKKRNRLFLSLGVNYVSGYVIATIIALHLKKMLALIIKLLYLTKDSILRTEKV